MAHVNWKTRAIGLTKLPHPTNQSQLELALTAEHLVELGESLAEAFAPGGAELRLELPGNWTVYWKIKTGLSRLQLAHPAADHWVATVHLSAEHGARLLESIAKLGNSSDAALIVGQLGAMAPIVNFELVLCVAKTTAT